MGALDTSGTWSGNANTATSFSSNATVSLTGDATGISIGSTKSWTVPVILAIASIEAAIINVYSLKFLCLKKSLLIFFIGTSISFSVHASTP